MQRDDRRTTAILLGAGMVLNLVLLAVCYGFALRLPLYFDDPPVLSWVDSHTLTDIWTSANENSYYRPVTFTVYWLSQWLEPPVRAVALHGLNLALHFLNGLLLTLVARRLGVRPLTALLASTLLIVFPFLFQAAPWVTALPHFLVTTLVLLSIYAFLRGASDNHRRWRLVALTMTLLAPLAHESGVAAGLIVGALALTEREIRQQRVNWMWAAAGVLVNAVAAGLRSQLPGVAASISATPNNWIQNGFFFLQGLVYPFGPLAGRLVFEAGLNDFLVIGAMALVLCMAAAFIAWRLRDRQWLIRGLIWWLFGALPSWLLLKYSYAYISPRLYALAAPGLALLWAELLTRIALLGRSVRWRQLILLLLAGGLVFQNVDFLLRQRQLHLDLSGVYESTLQAASDPANEPLLFVNLPSWLARTQQIYPLSTDGILFLPGYSNLAAFIGINTGRTVQASTVMFTPVLKVTGDFFGRSGEGKDWESMRAAIADARSVYLAVYREGRFQVQMAGRLEQTQPEPDIRPQATFEGGPFVVAAEVRQVEPGYWAITLDWYARGSLADHEIFVHVVDAGGQLVTQSDGPALGGMLPIWLWQPGDRIHDLRYIELPAGDKGPYTVRVGIYTSTGERLPVKSADGSLYPDQAADLATLHP